MAGIWTVNYEVTIATTGESIPSSIQTLADDEAGAIASANTYLTAIGNPHTWAVTSVELELDHPLMQQV